MYIGSQVNFGESIRTVQEDLRESRPPCSWACRASGKSCTPPSASSCRKPAACAARCSSALQRLRPLAEKPRSAWSLPTSCLCASYWLVLRALQNFIGLRNAHVALTGAAPIPPDVVRFFRVLGVPLIEVYGLTESTGMVTGHELDRVSVGTVGIPRRACVAHRIAATTTWAASSRSRATWCSPGYYKTPRPRRKASRTAGCTPATWCAWWTGRSRSSIA